MAVTVLGVQHRIGEYQGIHYDNYNLHCVEEVSGDTWTRTLKRFLPMCSIRRLPLTRFFRGTNIILFIIVSVGLLMFNL